MARSEVARIPAHLMERIRAKAEREGKTVSEVLSELLNQLPEELFEQSTKTPDYPRHCTLCGRPWDGPGRICEQCYYDPNVVYPQRVGLIFNEEMAEELPQLPSDPIEAAEVIAKKWEAFLSRLEKEGDPKGRLSDEEMEIFRQWMRWRRLFTTGEVSIYDGAWRAFVRRCRQHEGLLSHG